MQESVVVRIVESSIAKNKEDLLASMKEVLNESLSDIKRANAESAESHLSQIKRMKFDDPHRFKKKANEDQYKFNLKVSDAIEEAKTSCLAQKFDKVKQSLEKGESLLAERQKHILLADKSDFGWLTIQEYKKNDLADDSDDEKKIIRAEARARTQAKQNSLKNKSKFAGSKREFSRSLPVAASSTAEPVTRPIPTIDTQFGSQTEPGCCFACNKPGHWRA